MVYDEVPAVRAFQPAGFLNDYHSRLTDYHLSDERFTWVSARIERLPKGTLLIGNCTSKMKRTGVFVQGCPPVASHIWETLSGEKGEGISVMGTPGQEK